MSNKQQMSCLFDDYPNVPTNIGILVWIEDLYTISFTRNNIILKSLIFDAYEAGGK